MIKLAYTHAAQDDLAALYEEIATYQGEIVADATVDRLLGRCEDLARFPDMGRRRPDLDRAGLQARSITEFGRLIVYTKRGNLLHVARVLREA